MNEFSRMPQRLTAQTLIRALGEELGNVFSQTIPAGPLALVDFPDHSNVGDSAIWLGEMTWLRAQGRTPAYTAALNNFSVDDLRQTCPDGPILIHGGGNFGTSWMKHEELRLHLLESFPGRPIVQLPQSIHYNDEAAAAKMARAIEAHGAFTLLTRDTASFEFARRQFDCDVRLAPDSALMMGPQKRDASQEPILALLRTDHERTADTSPVPAGVEQVDWLHEDNGEKLQLRARAKLARLLGRGEQDKRLRRYQALAERRVQRGLAMLSRGRVVVTDRLHAHILSVLLDIPHVALDNNYGKVSGFARQWTGVYEGYRSATTRAEAFEIACADLGTN
ncbi:polysaccharide pyruvyl transferase family protein [Novosphingobium sp. PP1Y]|uniref:polysaccharide pyruvyl transferase family protein n=1 Tax=Novosphingobium sp. PP1Y TaxID=702113 RepID=UPI0002DC3FB4|nr:polysaccharide pyruvyl transferase family protein [Novosphingobium sp. PP1Y]